VVLYRVVLLVNSGDDVASSVPPVVVDHGVDDDVGAGLQETEAAHDAGFEAGDEIGLHGDREQLESGLVVPAYPLEERLPELLLVEEGGAVVDARHREPLGLAHAGVAAVVHRRRQSLLRARRGRDAWAWPLPLGLGHGGAVPRRGALRWIQSVTWLCSRIYYYLVSS
jgi:hypothetical protein